MRADLTNLLVCPSCRSPLRWLEQSCTCTSCHNSYPIEDGIPNLLPASAARSLGDDHTQAENTRLHEVLDKRPWLKAFVDAVRPPLPYDLHGRWLGQRTFVSALAERADREPLVLDLGSGDGRDEQLAGLGAKIRDRLIRTDLRMGTRKDFVSDAHHIPLPDGALDGVIFQGVAEHVARPWLIAQEIIRVLRPGGVVFCEAPFIQWYHEDPKDYYRFTEDGLKALFSPCACVESGVAIGAVGAVVGVSRELLPILFTSPYLYWPTKWIMAWLTYPLVLLDRFYRNRPRARTVALAVYLVARKPLVEVN